MKDKVNNQKSYKNKIGEYHITTEGYRIQIIDRLKNNSYTVQFDKGNISENKQYDSIKKGNIKNPFHASVFDIGYYGLDKHESKTNKFHAKVYKLWYAMLERCYSLKSHEKQPTYKGVTVFEEWHNFQNYAKWYKENYKPHMQGWHLDKDIVCPSCRIYSPETCYFVPPYINTLFLKCDSVRGEYPIGVKKEGKKYRARINKHGLKENLGLFTTVEEAFQAYKTTKEAHIKEVADKWKLKIRHEIYQSMINYTVKITD